MQFDVETRREGDENIYSEVLAEIILGNSLYDYQIMDRSRHTIAEHLGHEKSHTAKNEKFAKLLTKVLKFHNFFEKKTLFPMLLVFPNSYNFSLFLSTFAPNDSMETL